MGSESDLIFLEPIFLPKMWGGSWLKQRYGDVVPDGPVGECLVVSGHPDGDCRVYGGRFEGLALSRLWSEYPELFSAGEGTTFPYQVKLIDAQEDLSVQVHPDAEYASAHEGAEAKNECWYVLTPSQSGEIVIGHTANDRDVLRRLVEGGRWDELLTRRPMREGDFYYIPAGTAHCILSGSLIYEVMQPSSTTYRFYDFDRLDLDGTKRELHLEQAMEVLTVPHVSSQAPPRVVESTGATVTTFLDNEHFCVRTVDVESEARLAMDGPFLIASALAGGGAVNGVHVAAGEHFIVPGTAPHVHIEGRLQLIVTRP